MQKRYPQSNADTLPVHLIIGVKTLIIFSFNAIITKEKVNFKTF